MDDLVAFATTSSNKSHLAAHWAPIVRRMAARLAKRLPAGVNIDDLVSAGNLGLAQALVHYNPNEEARWKGYVTKRIRGAMLDDLRASDPLSRHQRHVVKHLDRVARRLASELGRWPGLDEVRCAARLPKETCDNAAAYAQHGVSQRGGSVIGSVFPDVSDHHTGSTSAEEDAIGKQEAARVLRSVERLPTRLKTVVSLYFREGLTLREIGSRMEITEPRVHQLRNEALALLRVWCSAPETEWERAQEA